MGVSYDSYAVLKFITPYTERKFPKEIAVNFINTGYLEVGNTFDSLKSVLNNLVESVNINNKRILMNGNYAKTLDKHSFETPYVIVRSDKGLPFIITGMDYKVDMSNYQGGAMSASAARESARAKMSALGEEKAWNLGVMRRNKADAYASNILSSWGSGINPMTGSNAAVILGNQAVLQDEINFQERQYDIEMKNLEAQSKQKYLGLF